MTPLERNEIRTLAADGDVLAAICKWLGYGEAFTKCGGVPPEIAAAVHAIRLELESYDDAAKAAKRGRKSKDAEGSN